jgi:hypothetical protein
MLEKCPRRAEHCCIEVFIFLNIVALKHQIDRLPHELESYKLIYKIYKMSSDDKMS